MSKINQNLILPSEEKGQEKHESNKGFESEEDLGKCTDSAMKMSNLDDLIVEYE